MDVNTVFSLKATGQCPHGEEEDEEEEDYKNLKSFYPWRKAFPEKDYLKSKKKYIRRSLCSNGEEI